jgi:hypothetical protein
MGEVEADESSDMQITQRGLVYLGEVEYIDLATEAISRLGYRLPPFMYKRKSFEHEHEVRAVILTSPYPEKVGGQPFTPKEITSKVMGWPVKVSLEDLLERVYIAPTAPDWFYRAVEAVTRKYGLTHKVIPSSLDETPPPY